MSMFNSIDDELIIWLLKSLKSLPKKYGSTGGTYELQARYINEIFEGTATPQALEVCMKIERLRSTALRVLSQYDFRTSKQKIKKKYSDSETSLGNRVLKLYLKIKNENK